MVRRMPGFFDVDERLRELSAKGDDLERVKSLVDFEIFRPAWADYRSIRRSSSPVRDSGRAPRAIKSRRSKGRKKKTHLGSPLTLEERDPKARLPEGVLRCMY